MPQDFGCPYRDDRCRRNHPPCRPCQHGHDRRDDRHDDHRNSRCNDHTDSRCDDHMNHQHGNHRDGRHDRPGYDGQRRW